jgi:hypothetical protein
MDQSSLGEFHPGSVKLRISDVRTSLEHTVARNDWLRSGGVPTMVLAMSKRSQESNPNAWWQARERIGRLLKELYNQPQEASPQLAALIAKLAENSDPNEEGSRSLQL